ncbi:MAG: peptidoglycan-binding protein [Myxococcota bacterium]
MATIGPTDVRAPAVLVQADVPPATESAPDLRVAELGSTPQPTSPLGAPLDVPVAGGVPTRPLVTLAEGAVPADVRPSLALGAEDRAGEAPWVSELQRRLGVPATGRFDEMTAEAARAFQQAYNEENVGRSFFVAVRTDGVVDGRTWEALVESRGELPPSRAEPDERVPPTLEVGSRDRPGEIGWVHELQLRLGISSDGVFGAGQTGPRVQEFQRGYNQSRAGEAGFVPLPTDGVVDTTTWEAIVETHRIPRPQYDQTPLNGALPEPYRGDTSLMLGLPERDPSSPGGSALLGASEDAIIQAVLDGNVPAHMRELVPVTVMRHGMEVEFYTLPDVLAVGSDDDYMAIPLSRNAADALVRELGGFLPTPQMVQDRWGEADYRFVPHPLGGAATAADRFVQSTRRHNEGIDRAGTEGALVAGTSKVYVTDPVYQNGDIGYFGWISPDGEPIQPSYVAHNRGYRDYSHGVLLAAPFVRIDGVPYAVEDIVTDPVLYPLLSDAQLRPFD